MHLSRNDSQAFLDLAVKLAWVASDIVMEVRGRGFAVRQKGDETPVTEADHRAEVAIVEALRAAFPAVPVVAEEEIAAGHVADPGQLFWLVDPLDGTREFAAGHEEFTVNIGLVHDGHALLGAVAVPVQGAVYAGIVGEGAWLHNHSGELRPIAVRPMPPEGAHVVASRHYATDEALAKFLAERRVASTQNIGSAVKFCRIAEGRADLYPRLGRTMEWDTAAPQAVLEAAGGTLRCLNGCPLRYGKPGWENPSFICTGRDDGSGG